mmetsp:Transcript_60826/g.144951  ORF Transcript_60826/g.144951 Transcript_60826/m.144951 type:complete len:160 (+) Transcript_60826:134-613(+)
MLVSSSVDSSPTAKRVSFSGLWVIDDEAGVVQWQPLQATSTGVTASTPGGSAGMERCRRRRTSSSQGSWDIDSEPSPVMLEEQQMQQHQEGGRLEVEGAESADPDIQEFQKWLEAMQEKHDRAKDLRWGVVACMRSSDVSLGAASQSQLMMRRQQILMQ